MNNGVSISVPEVKKYKTNQMLYLEVFRAVMQYIEEFG